MTELEEPIPRIVEALAEAADTEAAELEPPLTTVVDAEALETLLEAPTRSGLEVHFTYRGHDVVVDENGQVQVD